MQNKEMMINMKQITSILLGVMLLPLFGNAAGAAEPSAEQRARQIIEATGCRGGLIVHVGCGNGRLTAALRLDDRYLVHGLALDEAELSQARDYVRGQKSYGIVSLDLLHGKRLPYIDNLLNLVVVEETGRVDMNEVMRALAPGGVAYTKVGDAWEKTVKPRPGNIDEWTHFLHDSGGNAVAHDTVVGPPRHLQWRAAPDNHRSHESVASVHTVISAGGRIFFISDEGTRASMLMPPKWFLVARDAFNGVQLWKRPIKKWVSHLSAKGRKDHSNSLHRNLVASEKHVYATIGDNNAVVAVDPATGEILRTYESTEDAEEIIYSDGKLFVVNTLSTGQSGSAQTQIVALDADTGTLLWKKTDQDTATLLALTLAAKGGRVYFQNTEAVICLDAKSGREQWQYARNGTRSRVGGYAPTLVAFGDVVLSADSEGKHWSKGEIIALSAETGKRMWSGDCAMGYYAPVDVFVAGGLLWVGTKEGRGCTNGREEDQADFTEGLDLHTGEVKRRLDTSSVFLDRVHHPRCHRVKATERFILNGRHGVEYIPLDGEAPVLHDHMRGSCRYGVMPCNGLLYLPAHYCQCHNETLLNGFTALAPALTDSEEKLFGEFGDIEKSVPGLSPSEDTGTASTEDHWPAYRHDPERSGATKHGVSTDLKMKWQADLGGTLTSVVVSEVKLLVASPETHTVHALDAQTGKFSCHCTVAFEYERA